MSRVNFENETYIDGWGRKKTFEEGIFLLNIARMMDYITLDAYNALGARLEKDGKKRKCSVTLSEVSDDILKEYGLNEHGINVCRQLDDFVHKGIKNVSSRISADIRRTLQEHKGDDTLYGGILETPARGKGCFLETLLHPVQ